MAMYIPQGMPGSLSMSRLPVPGGMSGATSPLAGSPTAMTPTAGACRGVLTPGAGGCTGGLTPVAGGSRGPLTPTAGQGFFRAGVPPPAAGANNRAIYSSMAPPAIFVNPAADQTPRGSLMQHPSGQMQAQTMSASSLGPCAAMSPQATTVSTSSLGQFAATSPQGASHMQAPSGHNSPAAGQGLVGGSQGAAALANWPQHETFPAARPGKEQPGARHQATNGRASSSLEGESSRRKSPELHVRELQAEISRRQAAEMQVRDLQALVARLRQRIGILEGKRGAATNSGRYAHQDRDSHMYEVATPANDAIDRAICDYLDRNPDFPVTIQKVAQNYYVFGDRGTVYITQRGDHMVVRVGGGFKSLQVFMDERALMVTREAAGAWAEKTIMSARA
eukprot:CAMPEP_0170606132 /NCGR_PEP_ID=MMETSP0224-20130122/20343_1 /TAXON_ID=285029 /ORGANISM="Togula jolla, Strain CCCM 725" /LENGTH=392 /DNA_ID=CAMNT_0010931181 /DNA_START=21 /DNA_END=1199 /DNA_ORIENTATION=-